MDRPSPSPSPSPSRYHSSVDANYNNDDAASFYSSTTDPLSTPTNGYFTQPSRQFSGAGNHSGPAAPTTDDMYIDTHAANKGAKPQVTVSSPRPYPEERTPLLGAFGGAGAEAPPPSYLEATTPVAWTHAPARGNEGAGLLEEGGQRDAPLFTPLREERFQDGKYSRRSFRDHFTRRRVLRLGAAILVIVILAVIIAAVAHKDKKTVVVAPIPAPAQPIQSGAPKSKDKFPIRWPARCGKDYNVKSEDIAFGTTPNLKVVEAVHQLDGPYKRVSGWIHVAQGSSDQAPGTIEAKVSYAVSSSVSIDSIQFSHTPDSITIGDPTFPDGFDGVRPGSACLGISIALYVAPGATLQNFNVRATHLGMQIHEGVRFSVTNQTSISLTTGTLDSVSFPSRETRLETISGSISGKYSLLDLLYINTKSGSVNINVEPKEKAPDGTPTALFNAYSMSGSMRVDFERKNIPERDYVVQINTTVGSVDGSFIHGSKTELNSVAGSINVDLLPFKSGDYGSELITSTTDGQTAVRVGSPYKNAGVVMGKLSSTHSSVAGQLDVTYPQEWEGHLEGKSTTGKLHLQGKDLELTKKVENPGFSMVEAKKGTGQSTMAFKTVSGACDIRVGKA